MPQSIEEIIAPFIRPLLALPADEAQLRNHISQITKALTGITDNEYKALSELFLQPCTEDNILLIQFIQQGIINHIDRSIIGAVNKLGKNAATLGWDKDKILASIEICEEETVRVDNLETDLDIQNMPPNNLDKPHITGTPPHGRTPLTTLEELQSGTVRRSLEPEFSGP